MYLDGHQMNELLIIKVMEIDASKIDPRLT